MTQTQSSSVASRPTQWADGALFFALAIIAGLAGGLLGLFSEPHAGVSEPIAFRHGVLLDYFVVPVALLGGVGRWMLPRSIGARAMALPALDRICALGFLAAIIMLVAGGAHLAPVMDRVMIGVALAVWAVAMFTLSLGTIVTVLEERRGGFRALSTFVWSQLLAASVMILTTPLMLAEVTRFLLRGGAPEGAFTALLTAFHFPILAVTLILALGTTAPGVASIALTSGHDEGEAGRMALPVTALFAIVAVIGPLLWAHDFLHHTTPSFTVEIFSLALPSMGIVALICARLWSSRIVSSPVVWWSVGTLVFCSAGWGFRFALPSMGVDHAAVLFGALFAVFAGFYAWLDSQAGHPVPFAFALMHEAVFSTGAMMMIMPGQVFFEAGEIVMALALLFVPALIVWMMQMRPAPFVGGEQ